MTKPRRAAAPSTHRYPVPPGSTSRCARSSPRSSSRIDDERLSLVTITAIDVDSEMNRAIVFFDSLPARTATSEILEALASHRVRMQSSVGRQVRAKKTPDPDVPARRGDPRRRAHRADPARQGHAARAAVGARDRRRTTSRRAMARRRPPTTHGLAVVDKPAGVTSHDVVGMLRRRFGERQVGHAGTLDPDATGVLLVGVGQLHAPAAVPHRPRQDATPAEVVFGTHDRPLDSTRRGHGHVRHGRRSPSTQVRRGGRRAPHRPHPADAADGECGEGRRHAPARAGPRGHRGRACSRVRSPCTASTSTPRPTRSVLRHRGALLDGHLHPHARRRPRPAARRRRAPARPAPHGGRQVHAWPRPRRPTTCELLDACRRRVRDYRQRQRRRRRWQTLVRNGRVLDRRSTATDRGRSSTPTARCWPCTSVRRPARPNRRWCRSRRATSGLTATGAAGSVARTVQRRHRSRLAPPWPGERAVITIGAYDGVHLGHQAVIAEVRRCAAASAPGRWSSRSTGILHRSCGPRVRAAAAHRPRPEARAARCDRRRRHRGRPLRRGPVAARSRSSFVAAGARRLPRHVGHRGRRGLPLRPRPRRQRRHCCASSAPRATSRCSRSTLVSAPTASTSRSAPRPSGGRWPAARSSSPPRCSAARSRPAAWSCSGDQRGRLLGFPDGQRRGAQRHLPARRRRVRRLVRAPERRASTRARINLGRRPTFYEHADHSLLEAHLLDFDGDLYGERAEVRFTHFLRSERKFDGIDALDQPAEARHRPRPPRARRNLSR